MSECNAAHAVSLKAAGCPDHLLETLPAKAASLGISLPQILDWAARYGPQAFALVKSFVDELTSAKGQPDVG